MENTVLETITVTDIDIYAFAKLTDKLLEVIDEADKPELIPLYELCVWILNESDVIWADDINLEEDED